MVNFFTEKNGARSSGFQMKLLNVNATAQFLTPGYTGNETNGPIIIQGD